MQVPFPPSLDFVLHPCVGLPVFYFYTFLFVHTAHYSLFMFFLCPSLCLLRLLCPSPLPPQDVERLRDELCRREEECLQRERRLAGLELQVRERTGLVTQLEQQLEEATRRQRDLQLWLDEATSHGRDTKEQLTSKLRECEQALTRQAAMPPQVKVSSTLLFFSVFCSSLDQPKPGLVEKSN